MGPGLALWALLPLGAAGKPPPSWVERFPLDPAKYVGIGRGDKLAQPGNYREAAQSAALAQISREISIQLHAENTLSRSEGNAAWDESYTEKITGSSRNDLSGYSLEDVYESEKEIWVYYTLDKERFRRSRDERTRRFQDWLGLEAAALDFEARARDLPVVMRRWAGIREACAAPIPLGAASLCASIAGKMRARFRGMRLETPRFPWVLGLAEGPDKPGRVEVALIDAGSRERWKGPFLLALENLTPENPVLEDRNVPGTPCPVETDGEGHLDLAGAFLACGMRPGICRVTWRAPDSQAVRLDVRIDVVPIRVGLAVRGGGSRDPGGLFSGKLAQELAALRIPYYRIDPGRGRPALEVRLQEAVVDSLDGMYFTSLRGKVFYPGIPGGWDITGEAGHADRSRSGDRAVADFVKKVERGLIGK